MGFDYQKWEMQFHAARESRATVGFRHSGHHTDIVVRDEHGEPLAVLKGVGLGSIAECAAYLTAFVESRGGGYIIEDNMPEMRAAVEKQPHADCVSKAESAEAQPESPAEESGDKDLAVSTLRKLTSDADPNVRLEAAKQLLVLS